MMYGFIKRLFLFQFVFLFAFLKYTDISTSSYEFKDKIYEFSTSVNFKHPVLEELLKNPITVFQFFIGFQAVCALLAILGSRLFSFLTAICLIITDIIYFNPFQINPNTKKPNMSLNNLNIQQFPLEFILLATLAMAMLTQAFKTSKCETTYVIEEEITKDEKVNSNKREVKVKSQKNKKRI